MAKSRVNEAGNYTKPAMRKALFNRIKAGTKGGKAGQWSARKAQMLAKQYKAKGGGYRLWHFLNHRDLFVHGQDKNGEPNQVNLVHKGQKLLVNVIYLKRQLRLFLPPNMPRLQLKSERQLEEVNKFLNSQKRLQQKRKNTEATRRLKEKLNGNT